MTFTRKQAKMIAEELYSLMKSDIEDVAKEVVRSENEEFLSAKQVAELLHWHPATVYRHKDDIGCYVKNQGKLLFVKSQLYKAIQSGRLA